VLFTNLLDKSSTRRFLLFVRVLGQVWEIFALRPAFKGYSKSEFAERVVREKQRLPIERSWPPLTRGILREAWDDDPERRPDMKRIGAMMRGDLREMSTDVRIRERAAFMRNRSAHSFRLSSAKDPSKHKNYGARK